MEIEIFADVVCPWCWIGEHRLFQALASVEGVSVRWRAFQLDPKATSDGTPLVHWLGQRYGGEANARRMFDRVREIGRGEGLTMNFEQAIAANSFDAHRLIWAAHETGVQREMAEALHRAHFTDGLDIGSPAVLATIASNLRVRDVLSTGEGADEVRADIERGHALGVTGVPMFVFDGRHALSGAQEAETFREALALLGR
jgi:predicted DsbA family dithiol-disulfide isomerase